jgi:hypothetical protein
MIYACTKNFFIIVLVGAPGDARKPDIFILNGQLFRSKIQHFAQNSLQRACASNIKQQNKIVAHPADHGNIHFGLTQQPTSYPAALVNVVKR